MMAFWPIWVGALANSTIPNWAWAFVRVEAWTCVWARVAVKAPVLDLGRKIDGLAQDAVFKVVTEKARLNGLLTRFMVRQREAAEALERARQAEMKRLADEQARRDREEREQAEAAAKAAEAARKAAEAEFLSDPNDGKAKAEALEAQRKADEELKKAEQARIAKATAEASRLQAMVSSKPITAPKIAGISVRDTWNYKVTDLYALYTARPDLCTITDRRAEILRELRAGVTIPGVESWKETTTGVRG